jgi:exodeoxyribonuclease VIII
MTVISNADYHADPAISASQLKEIGRSPFHYWKRYVDPDRSPSEPTAAMRLGSLVHCAVLEPKELLQRYAVGPDRRTKEGKATAEKMLADGIEPVSASDFEQALSMAAAVHSHSTAGLLLGMSGQAEQSFWWDDIATGLRCKCRPDWFDGELIVDLKTCQDASPAGFGKAVANFGYQIQAAHYLAGTLAKRFIFVAVEKTYPFAVGVYELDPEALVHGSIARHNALQRIQDCRAVGEWSGYTDGIQTLQLPGWALKDNTFITSEDF